MPDTDTQGVALEPKGLEAALEAANELTCGGGAPVRDYVAGIIRAYLSAVGGEALREATSLAVALFNKHFRDDEEYASGRVVWEPLPVLRGVISQIDNMTAGMSRTARLKAQPGVEGEWHRLDGDDNILLYTLVQDGWRKGEPVMVNDVTIRIEAANGSRTSIGPIADRILPALAAPVSQEPVDAELREAAKSMGAELAKGSLLVGSSTQPSEKEPVTANCCQCGRIIDTREENEGGDSFGCQIENGKWTCSFECYCIETGQPIAEGEPSDAEVERALSTWFEENDPWYHGMANDVVDTCRITMRKALLAAKSKGGH